MFIVYGTFLILLVSYGAAIMALEILSSHLMAPFFGGSIYIWGSIISSFLVHFSVGYVLGGYLSKRNSSFTHFSLFLLCASLWILAIPKIYIPICEYLTETIDDIRLGSLLAMNLIFFVPVTIMASVAPFIIGSIPGSHQKRGFTAGLVLFISTVGSFLGTNVTAFYLIDLFPVSRIIMGIGLYCLFITVIVLLLRIDRRLVPKERF